MRFWIFHSLILTSEFFFNTTMSNIAENQTYEEKGQKNDVQDLSEELIGVYNDLTQESYAYFIGLGNDTQAKKEYLESVLSTKREERKKGVCCVLFVNFFRIHQGFFT